MMEKNITVRPFEFMYDVHRLWVSSLVHVDTYINLVTVE